MGKLRIKSKEGRGSYMKRHGYVVVAKGQKPPRRQKYMVVNEKGERIK